MKTGISWIEKRPKAAQWTVILLLTGFWALAVAGRLVWNGDVYGLYYGLLHGDGACYTFAAYDLVGQAEKGIREIERAYSAVGVPIDDLTNPETCVDRMVTARVLYPLLSVPFVLGMGIYGMLIVPSVSWLVGVLVPVILLVRRGYYLGALIAGGLVIASSSIARWSVANITDALLMALSALMIFSLPLFSRPTRRRHLLALALLVVLASLTKQSWPIWIMLVVGPWLVMGFRLRARHERFPCLTFLNPWTALVLVVVPLSLGMHVLISNTLGEQNPPHLANVAIYETVAVEIDSAPLVGKSEGEALGGEGDGAKSVAETSGPPIGFRVSQDRLGYLFLSVFRVAIADLGQLVVLDRALLLLIGLALLSTWLNRRWIGSIAFLSVLFATVAMSLASSALGINFRFQLPAVPFMILCAGLVVRLAKTSIEGNLQPSGCRSTRS